MDLQATGLQVTDVPVGFQGKLCRVIPYGQTGLHWWEVGAAPNQKEGKPCSGFFHFKYRGHRSCWLLPSRAWRIQLSHKVQEQRGALSFLQDQDLGGFYRRALWAGKYLLCGGCRRSQRCVRQLLRGNITPKVSCGFIFSRSPFLKLPECCSKLYLSLLLPGQGNGTKLLRQEGFEEISV